MKREIVRLLALVALGSFFIRKSAEKYQRSTEGIRGVVKMVGMYFRENRKERVP